MDGDLSIHSHLPIQHRLNIESLRRTKNGAIPQILLVCLSWILIPTSNTFFPLFSTLFILIIAQQTFRLIYITRNRTNFVNLVKNFKLLMVLSFGTAICWSLSAALAFKEFSLHSEQGVIFGFNILGYIAGMTYSFASVPRMQKFMIPILAWPMLAYLIYENTTYAQIIGGMFFVYVAYLYAISRDHSSDLLHIYQTEEVLRSEKEKLKKVINSVPGFVAMADPTGQWIDFSDSFESLLSNSVLQSKKEAFRQSAAEAHVEEVEWQNGSEHQFYIVSFARLRNPPDSIVTVGVPVNELKEMQNQLELQRSKVEFASRLSMIGEMAGGMAHEVNNPLAIIVATTFQLQRYLEETLPEASDWRIPLGRIEQNSHRISAIIKSLQYFSRQGDRDPLETVSVSFILDRALQINRQRFIKNKIELIVSEPPDAKIVARPVQIGQVLINLLNNAFDSVLKSDERRIELKVQKKSEGVFFSVTDSGPGIPREISGRVFEPFFTTKDVTEGTGLGLSVSKGIIQDHKGDLTFQSVPGRTTFEFFIPNQPPT